MVSNEIFNAPNLHSKVVYNGKVTNKSKVEVQIKV